MKTIICAECNVIYAYEPNPNYPDKRKYCANCSEKKKATWDAKLEPIAPVAETVNMNMEVNTQTAALTEDDSLEYQIRSREIRARALEAAIKVTKKLNTEDYHGDLMEHAKQFEQWILNGK